MRKFLTALAFFTIANTGMAQSGTWILSPVIDHHRDLKPVVGFIYQTAAQGTAMAEKPTKVITKLELLCNATGNPVNTPLIALFWQGIQGNIAQMIDIKVDGKFVERTRWEQDDALYYRSISESAQLLQAMRTGKSITFDFLGPDGTRRVTMFDLRDYNSNLSEFKKNCNL